MSEPLRVLQMIGSLNIGGSQAMIINLYKSIDREKIQFDYIIDKPEELFYEKEILELGGKIYTMPCFNGKNYFEIRHAWDVFFKTHPEYRVLHSHVRSYASIYLPIAKKNGVKTIIHSHSTSNGRGIKSFVKWVMQYPLKYQADYYFGCSKEAGEWLFGKKIVNSEKYHMLQNAIDIKKYIFSEEIRKQYRKDLKISEDSLVFIHVGRFDTAKNHSFLIDIFNDIVHDNRNSLLLLVGDGAQRQNIETKIAELDLKSNVLLLGRRTDVPKLLMMSDCFIFPSKWEGLPVTVVEAQATGLPCFVSDTVTKDVNVSDLVVNLPIDQGTTIWKETIINSKKERKNVSSSIVEAGFDISTSAIWITDFYWRLVNG